MQRKRIIGYTNKLDIYFIRENQKISVSILTEKPSKIFPSSLVCMHGQGIPTKESLMAKDFPSSKELAEYQ